MFMVAPLVFVLQVHLLFFPAERPVFSGCARAIESPNVKSVKDYLNVYELCVQYWAWHRPFAEDGVNRDGLKFCIENCNLYVEF
jgi:hypothetical protein